MIARCIYSSIFYAIRLWHAQSKLFLVLVSSCSLTLLALGVCLQEWQQKDSLGHQLLALQLSATSPHVSNPLETAGAKIPVLPEFDSAVLVDTLNQIASEISLPVDEVSYVLDDGAAQPYLRYRVTLTVASNYPLIRRFIDGLGMNLPHVTLDSISCSRDDIALPVLSCDLAFSAFFRRSRHG